MSLIVFFLLSHGVFALSLHFLAINLRTKGNPVTLSQMMFDSFNAIALCNLFAVLSASTAS